MISIRSATASEFGVFGRPQLKLLLSKEFRHNHPNWEAEHRLGFESQTRERPVMQAVSIRAERLYTSAHRVEASSGTAVAVRSPLPSGRCRGCGRVSFEHVLFLLWWRNVPDAPKPEISA